MSKFLYGAAVQGIQNFIFRTNTLKEIIGASELVEDICTNLFAEQLGKSLEDLKNDDNVIVNAAGNIKYIFEKEEECRGVFKEFPKKVLLAAPGITISQAVVTMEDGDEISDKIKELESKLRCKRNQPLQSMEIGLMGIQRSRQTGLPERWHNGLKENQYCDEGTYRKLMAGKSRRLWEKATGKAEDSKDISDNVSYFTGNNDWIAVIHADGNGLGNVVKKIGENAGLNTDYHEFSFQLDKSTCDAAKVAFEKVLENCSKGEDKPIPFRPVVLGGDDLTVIIRGDLAIDFTKEYLRAFESNTKENFGGLAKKYSILGNGLTACAGVAFIKSSFPYYYGYNLAEELCSEAKKASKREHSCLMFHKVQDSYVSSYEEIEKRELTTPDNYSFKFGPYFLKDIEGAESFWCIDRLLDLVVKLNGRNGNALKSDIRQWLSAMMETGGSAKAAQLLRRLETVNPDLKTTRTLTSGALRNDRKVYPAYDVMSLHSICYLKTK